MCALKQRQEKLFLQTDAPLIKEKKHFNQNICLILWNGTGKKRRTKMNALITEIEQKDDLCCYCEYKVSVVSFHQYPL